MLGMPLAVPPHVRKVHLVQVVGFGCSEQALPSQSLYSAVFYYIGVCV